MTKPNVSPIAALIALMFLLLQACTSAPPPIATGTWAQREAALRSLDHWQLQGRVNARYYDEAHTPRIRWQQTQQHYSILLWGTLNAGRTLIEGGPGQVSLEQAGEIRTANRPEELILQQLGYELPVSQLNYWIRGLPNPDEAHRLQLGEFDQVIRLEQAGWTLEYTDYRLFGDYTLPRRIDMKRNDEPISLTFIGLNWTLGDSLAQ
ncbi:MAG: lipoprotein insertase outer membrane protein LolB [Pseudohongiellaceae bacterium]